MGETYSISEVFEMAEEIERNGGRFYRMAADVVEDGHTKAVMLELAKAEDMHEKVFAAMHKEVCDGKMDYQWYDPEGEGAKYIHSMASTHVFNLKPNVAELVASIQSAESALRLAISFEKDTIALFSALRGAVREENQAKVDRLIQEEVGHVRQINETIAALKQSR